MNLTHPYIEITSVLLEVFHNNKKVCSQNKHSITRVSNLITVIKNITNISLQGTTVTFTHMVITFSYSLYFLYFPTEELTFASGQSSSFGADDRSGSELDSGCQ